VEERVAVIFIFSVISCFLSLLWLFVFRCGIVGVRVRGGSGRGGSGRGGRGILEFALDEGVGVVVSLGPHVVEEVFHWVIEHERKC
jgi:hypothetical protein